MFIDATSLVRRRCLAGILLTSMMCLPVSGWAQHGGGGHGGGGHSGGGHSNGGHSGGGHSSHTRSTPAHTGGHLFGWLHFNFRNRSGSRGAAPPANPADTFLRSAELRKRAPIHALPSTSIRTIPLDSPKFLAGKESSTPSRFRHQPRLLLGRFPCVHSSGCFFNGFNQVCFFEAALPVFFSSGFYWPFFDIGFGGDAMDQPGDLMWADTMPTGVAADTYSALANPPSTSAASVGPPAEFPGKGLDPRFFLLILKNATDLVVTDYWAEDGYIEYVSRDGSRSHIPIEALDLQASVTANSYRGLPFILRSVPPEP